MSVLSKLEKIEKFLPEKGRSLYLKQIQYAIYKRGTVDFMQMTTIPLVLRQKLKQEIGEVLSLKNIWEVSGGQAHKVLFETESKDRIEAVRMLFKPESDDSYESLCISSQSGCALGCKFCATGAIGFKKNLTSEEITDEVLYFKSKKFAVDSISFMGMGEPLSNAENVFEALKILTDKDFFNLGDRHINVSTVGIVPQIRRLTKEFPQVNLAFSLHSPFPEQRAQLMPVTNSYPIDKVFEALDERIKLTKRRIFLAYLLLAGVNDSLEQAKALADLIKKRGPHSYLYHVNLIRFNPGPEEKVFKKAERETVDGFKKYLEENKISVSLRQSFG
ncbi:MAG: radical SAM protein, partial [Patescibacteria group bacterium]|nr:radical SAM protein [Patescibacteria group bacterium]